MKVRITFYWLYSGTFIFMMPVVTWSQQDRIIKRLRLFLEAPLLCSSVRNTANIVMDRYPSDFRKQSNLGPGILLGSRGTWNSCTLLIVSVTDYLVSESSQEVAMLRNSDIMFCKSHPSRTCAQFTCRHNKGEKLIWHIPEYPTKPDLLCTWPVVWVGLEYLEFRDV